MELSVSILGIKENIKENVLKLDNTNISYLHLDIMDGIFVENKTWETSQLYDIVKNCRTKLDVHLMVSDVYKYVTEFSKFNPEYITFHYEAVSDVRKIINYIKSFNIKVGLAIKPNTPLIKIKEFLGEIDLVLIMSVEPGQGGQDFLMSTNSKLNDLRQLQKEYNFVIEVDGGIKDTNISKVNTDISVIGSFITNGDYKEQIRKIYCEVNYEK